MMLNFIFQSPISYPTLTGLLSWSDSNDLLSLISRNSQSFLKIYQQWLTQLWHFNIRIIAGWFMTNRLPGLTNSLASRKRLGSPVGNALTGTRQMFTGNRKFFSYLKTFHLPNCIFWLVNIIPVRTTTVRITSGILTIRITTPTMMRNRDTSTIEIIEPLHEFIQVI